MKGNPERSSWFYRVIEEYVEAAVSCFIDVGELIAAFRAFPWPVQLHPGWQKQIENPYYWAFKGILSQFTASLPQLEVAEPIDFIFDQDSEKKIIISSWDRVKYNSTGDVRRLLGNTPQWKDDVGTLPLQAADLYAYWVREWERQGIANAIEVLPFPWKIHARIPRMQIRYGKDHFIQEFQGMVGNPEFLRRYQMTDEEIGRGLDELKEEDERFMAGAEKPPESIDSPNLVKVYANNVNFGVTAWDFQFTFGELFNSQGVTKIENKVRVSMSPQQAKVFSRVLARNVGEYEQRLGEIKLPPERQEETR
jgi:hypothetical protein